MSNSSDIQKLTLELLMNKNQYNKYISKTDPHRYSELQERNRELQQYKDAILQMTEQLLDDPDAQINTDVQEDFENYTKTCIRYFKMRELADTDEDEDTELLFPPSKEPVQETPRQTMNSFWSKDVVTRTSTYIETLTKPAP
jgi:hypothetical protein